MPPLRLAISALLLISLAACDSNRDRFERGSFQAELTGGLSFSMEGDAVFQRSSVDGEAPPTFSISMIGNSDGSTSRSLVITETEPTISGVGTYTLRIGEDIDGVGLSYFDQPDSPSLISTSGTLEITEFDERQIEGTFTATLATPAGTRQTQATGSFDATRLSSLGP